MTENQNVPRHYTRTHTATVMRSAGPSAGVPLYVCTGTNKRAMLKEAKAAAGKLGATRIEIESLTHWITYDQRVPADKHEYTEYEFQSKGGTTGWFGVKL